ncbi:MAG: winged helix-turn-helix domain-containing protein, partial [Candidatus Rokubacteria bacterium]|nr:winged helix-turn-helix domain-containing protein [Candidatus Rokubacteria bacterium]
LTRQNLAELAGTTVETTIRVLGRWGREGLIADEEGHLLLRDLPALRALAGDGSAEP